MNFLNMSHGYSIKHAGYYQSLIEDTAYQSIKHADRELDINETQQLNPPAEYEITKFSFRTATAGGHNWEKQQVPVRSDGKRQLVGIMFVPELCGKHIRYGNCKVCINFYEDKIKSTKE